MKFLEILLLYFCKCSGDSSVFNLNPDVTQADNDLDDLFGAITDSGNETTTSTAAMLSENMSKQPYDIQVNDQSEDEANNSGLQVAQLENKHCENLDSKTAEPRCPPFPEGVYISTLSMCMIAICMLIMFVTILYLVYALHKAKSNGYKCIANETNPTVITGEVFNRQTSQDKSSPTIVQLEGIAIDDTYFKHTSSVRDVTRNNLTPTSSSSRRDSKVLRIIKNNNPQTNLILREQIKEICQGVLNNPIALKSRSPKGVLLDVEGLERRPSHKSLAREKSISSPQLDIYDTIPCVNQKDSTPSIDTKTPPEELESNKIATKDCIDTAETSSENYDEISIYDNPQVKPEPYDIEDIPVYDSVPSQPPKLKVYTENKNNLKVVVEDSDNLLVIDFNQNDSENITEPSYENAKKNDFML